MVCGGGGASEVVVGGGGGGASVVGGGGGGVVVVVGGGGGLLCISTWSHMINIRLMGDVRSLSSGGRNRSCSWLDDSARSRSCGTKSLCFNKYSLLDMNRLSWLLSSSDSDSHNLRRNLIFIDSLVVQVLMHRTSNSDCCKERSKNGCGAHLE